MDDQLAMLARAEARLLQELQAEADALARRLSAWDLPGLGQALTAYHHRRIELAVPLLLELEGGGEVEPSDAS